MSIENAIENAKLILDSLPDMIAILDNQHNIVFANKSMSLKLGIQQDELIGHKCYECIHGTDQPLALCPHSMLLRDGENHEIEMQENILGGYCNVTCSSIRDENGILIGSIHTVKEINEIKKAEKNLIEEKNKAQGYLDIAGAIILVVNSDQTVSLINKYGCEILGYSEDEIIGKNWFDNFLPEEAREEMRPAFIHILTSKNVEPYGYWENLILTKDGDIKHIAWSNTILKDNSGNFVGTLSSGMDITEQRLIDEEREIAINLLRLLNANNNLHDLMKEVTNLLHELSECESVGIRINDGADYPYFETRGFPAEFVELESQLCEYDESGELLRDSVGNPVLECMCGNVISGRFNPELPFFTEFGSFWTNSTTELLASTSEEDRQSRTRNRCNGEGYESVALIPLRSAEGCLGLLQFNDKHKGRFKKSKIEFFERLADNLTIAMSQRKAIKELRDTKQALEINENRYRNVIKQSGGVAYQRDWQNETYTFMDEGIKELTGYSTDEMTPKLFVSLIYDQDDFSKKIIHSELSQQIGGETATLYKGEYSIRNKDGQIKYVADLSIELRDTNNKIIRSLGMFQDITERKMSEEQLRASEEKYRTLFDSSADAIFIHDLEGRFLEANKMAIERLGYCREELLNMTVKNIDTPEFAELLPERIKQLGEKGYAFLETEHIAKDGRKIPVELNAKVIDYNGMPAILSIARDITERKQAELEIQSREQLYRNTIESTGAVPYRRNYATNSFEFIGEGIKVLTGYHADEFTSLLWDSIIQDLVPSGKFSGMTRDEANQKSALEKSESFQWDVRIKTAHGEERWLSDSSYQIRGEDGKLVMEFGILQDITEQKQRQIEYQTIIHTSIDGFMILDTLGNILEVNNAYCKISGYTRAELLNMNISDVEINESPEQIKQHISKLKSVGYDIFETKHRHKDGSIMDIEISTTYDRARFYSFIRDITERKQAEEKLRQNETRLGVLVNILQYQTDNIQDFLDYALNEAIKLTDSKIGYIYYYYEDRQEFVLNTWSKNVMNECLITKPETIYHLDKTGIWGESVRQKRTIIVNDYQMPNPLKKCYPEGHVNLQKFMTIPISREGKIVAVIGVANKETDYDDIDVLQLTLLMDSVWKVIDRKKSEILLRENEEKYRALVESLPDVIMRFDRDGKHLYVSASVTKNTGMLPNEFIGKTHREIGFPDGKCNYWEHAISSVFNTGKIHEDEFEFEFDGINGNVIYNWRLVPELDENNDVQTVLSIARDVTEHRKTEKSYQDIFNSMANGFALHEIICDESAKPINYRFLDVNPAFERLTGLSRESAIGKTALELLPNLESYWIDRYGESALTGNPTYFEEYSQGLGKYFEVTVYSPQKGQFVTIFDDITDRKNAEELQMKLQQTSKLESIGRLAGGVAHDFNNMLTVIQGSASLAMMGLNPNDPLLNKLKMIEDASNRATTLTRQLLAFSRKQLIEPQIINLNDVIKNLKKMLGRLLGEDIALQTFLHKDLANINADPGQIEQIIINLAVNSRDAMPNGGKLTLETSNISINQDYCMKHPEAKEGHYIQMSISDNGSGMSEETKKHIFEPFFTTKKVGEGTGLGLATVYGIVKQHNGYIECYSELGHDTTFKIYIPQNENKNVSNTIRKETIQDKMAIPTGNETILLVEDDDIVREITVEFLKQFGYNILIAGNGGAALIIAGQYNQPIDLLMTDVVMPGINGRELSERLLKIHSEMKVLYTSGYTQNVIAHHGILEEGLNFIGKPYRLEALAKKLRDVLTRIK